MRHFVIITLLFVISLTIFTFRSEVIGFEFKGDENFYFQASRQMVETGDWVTPYYFHAPRFQKPPLYYWIVGSLFKISSMKWSIARFPAAVSTALIVVLTYLFGIRFFNEKTAVLSAIVVMTSLAVFRYSRLALPEAFATFLLCASLYLMLGRYYILSYILMALAMLTKGPVGVILPLLIMAGYSYGMGERSFFKRVRLIPGILIVLLISLPWFVMMARIHGRPYIDHILFRETLQRISGLGSGARLSLKAILNYLEALVYFIPVVFLFYLPWSLLFVNSVKSISSHIKKGDPFCKGAVFSFVWFFAIFIFFTFLGEKHRHYMLTLSVPFGLMTGSYLHRSVFTAKNFKGAFVFAMLIAAFFSFESAKLVMNRAIGGIGAIFEGRSYNITAEDNVAIGSHSMIPQALEVFVNHPVEQAAYKWPDRQASDKATADDLNDVFLNVNNSFLLMKEKDFNRLIRPETKKRLTFLGSGYIYNKNVEISGVLDAARKADWGGLFGLFREKVYFVTTKKDGHL